MKFIALLCSLSALATSAFAQSQFQIDFGSSGTPLTSGYTAVNANFLANTPVASGSIPASIGSGTIDFSIANVGAYSSGNVTEPLTTDGIYTFGNNTNDHTFTISGLNDGDLVTLYAVSGWDGNGRGGVINFGLSATQAQTLGDPGTTPTLANFTLINALPVVAGANGIVTGTLNGAGGVGSDSEGQIGGFIIEVSAQAIPEPSSVALLIAGAGFGGLILLRRSRKAPQPVRISR